MRAVNDKFLELPEDKRRKIINAGLEVFGRYDYRHASTEEIAAKAGISKGLLFYYFQNKQSLYTFLFEWATEHVKAAVVDESMWRITDFFELCACAAERKVAMLRQSPWLMEFIMRAFYSQREPVSEEMNRRMSQETANIFTAYFGNVDFSPFRADVDPKEIHRMLTWMTDGFLHERQLAGQPVELEEIMEQFRLWSGYFKRIAYKEENLI